MKKLLFFISIALLFSCKEKNKPQVIEGYIREYYSGKPLPNIRVRLYELEAEWLGPVSFTFITEINTDGNGYYKFYEENGRNKNYVLRLSDPTQTHYIKDYYDLDSDSKIKVKKTNFNLYKITPVKLHVTNSAGSLRSINIGGNSSGFRSVFDKIGVDTVVYAHCYYGISEELYGVVYEGSFGKVIYSSNPKVSFTNPDTNYLEININK